MRHEILDPDAGPEEVCARFDVSRESCARLGLYVDELNRWQKRINLVGPGTLSRVWVRHVADGLQLLPLLQEGGYAQLVDLGSGGGVPGLVVALALHEGSDLHVVLVESNAKKAAFLRHVVREAGICATILNTRIEHLDVDALGCGAQTAVTARALAPLPKLLELAGPMLERGATGLFLKGQDVDGELTEVTRYWKLRVRSYPSVTDPGGVILKVEEIRRA